MQRTELSRRSFLQLAAGSTAVAALAACAPPAVPAGTTTDASAEPVTLNFFNRGGQFIENVMDQQMSLYRESNPNIEFEINAVAGASHQEALLIMISAGTGPDMWFDANRTTGPLTRRGVTTNLEPYFEADPDLSEDDYGRKCLDRPNLRRRSLGASPGTVAPCSWPSISTLFDEVGVPHPEPDAWMTWDEIIELAKVLTFDLDDNSANDSDFDPARVRQYGLRAGFGHGRPTYIWGNDAEIIADDGTMPMDSDAFIEAMNWLADSGSETLCQSIARIRSSWRDQPASRQRSHAAHRRLVTRPHQPGRCQLGHIPGTLQHDQDILRPLLAPVRLLPDRLSPGILRFHLLGLPQQSRAADSCRSGYAAADPQRSARTVPHQ